MAKFYEQLDDKLTKFIQEQKIFFTGTAAADGRVNVSPKGTDSLRVSHNQEIVWLNLSGSGNETAAHLLAQNRMTLMFCSFEKTPLILRVYGKAKTLHPRDKEWQTYAKLFPPKKGARNIFVMTIDTVQTSCGFAVPLMEFKEERTTLDDIVENRTHEQIEKGWSEKNAVSIDGLPTGI